MRCPSSTLTDLIMIIPWVAQTRLPGMGWPGPDRCQLVHLWANLALLSPLQIIPDRTLSISKFYFVLQISQPPNVAKNCSVFRIYIWISVFRRKQRFRNPFLGSWYIKQIQKVIFLGRPVFLTIFSNFKSWWKESVLSFLAPAWSFHTGRSVVGPPKITKKNYKTL